MGIRYYAYPVAAQDTERARVAPRTFISKDPFFDVVSSKGDQIPMLYLDKCWRHLQDLLRGGGDSPPRPAYNLVRGQVVMNGRGLDPVIRSLTPEEVLAVAQDIRTVTKDQVEAKMPVLTLLGHDRHQEFQYVIENLNRAKAFTALLASEGRGLVYLIG